MASTGFLTLVNRVLRRVNEVEMAQADFTAARGINALAKDAVNASIQRINQAEFTWPFNVSTGSQVLTVGVEFYDWPANYLIADWKSFAISRDDALSEVGRPLTFIDRDLWLKRRKQEDDYASTDGVSTPEWVFAKHGEGFGVSPSPDQAYTVTYDYWTIPTDLSAFDDTSDIPSTWDEVIVQGALYHIYMWRDNSEQAQLADKQFQNQLKNMRSLLINKVDRVYGSIIARSTGRGNYAVSMDGYTW